MVPPIPSEPLNAPEEFPDAPIEVAAPTSIPSQSESTSQPDAPVEATTQSTPPKPKPKSKRKSKSKSQPQPDTADAEEPSIPSRSDTASQILLLLSTPFPDNPVQTDSC